MPFYQVFHSYPLTDDEQQAVASAITNLHATTFTTPTMFVHVQFTRSDESGATTYFMAGKRRTIESNRIVGVVRTSTGRTKADFDTLAQKIEDAWYDAVGVQLGELGEPFPAGHEAKKLSLVAFTPLITVREAGVAAPEAGQEGAWFRGLLPVLHKLAASDNDIAEMLEEVKGRDDLKKLLG